MKQSHKNITIRNPMQYKAAVIRAAFVVRTDARMLGLPKARDPLIEVCALRAIGIDEAQLEFKHYGKLAPESQDVVFEVMDRAIEAARAEIAAMPPVRPA